MLDDAGDIELDGTVTRLASDRFLVVAPTAFHSLAEGLLRRAADGRAACVFDATSALATIAVTGPRSRELLMRITRNDLSNAALPWSHGAHVEIADGNAWCLRVSFTGELGFELYPTADLAINVWDAVIDAGADLGVRPFGFHALDSLRAEKGYRHLGHDIGNLDDPFEAALGYTVSMNKPGGFRGRQALTAKYGAAAPRPSRRQVFVRLSDPEPLLYGDESLFHAGDTVGRLTSAAYGHTLDAAVAPGDSFEVDCAGTMLPATVADRPFHDPTNERLRS
jgi:heterotetrameric sarcosine oxidase gamma subunit